jgi:hypothetical protein
MIIEVPNAADFEQTGLDYLNLAADQAFSLSIDFIYAGYEASWEDEIREFWRAAQRQLASALALVEQGAQFMLKARIAEISPFLLIVGTPRDWPRGIGSRDVPFAEFRTLDAQDLVRVHDAVSANRVSSSFAAQFEQLRRRRNTVMHTVDRTLEVTAKEIILLALESVHELLGPRRWIGVRREYHERAPGGGEEFIESQLLVEVDLLIDVLTRAELLRYFCYRKNQRSYPCPVCIARYQYGDSPPSTAQLRPNTAIRTNLHCFVCEGNSAVLRKDCCNSGCRSNVILEATKECVTCYEPVPFE